MADIFSYPQSQFPNYPNNLHRRRAEEEECQVKKSRAAQEIVRIFSSKTEKESGLEGMIGCRKLGQI